VVHYRKVQVGRDFGTAIEVMAAWTKATR